jgi:hypothetical protein
MKTLFSTGIFCLILASRVQAQNNTFPATGNVGIGTTSPMAPLSLGATFSNSKLALWDNGSGSARCGFGVQNAQFRLHLGVPADRFSFLSAEAGTELMTLTGTGNLGIGISNPQSKLHVDGDIKLSGNLAWGKGLLNLDQNGSIELGGNNGVAGGGTPFLDFHYSTLAQDYNTRIINDADGRLSVFANTLYANGDIKLDGNLAWGKGALTLNQNGSIELGGTDGVAGGGTPFLDFHYNTLAQDYNTRIINDADGRLSVIANTLYAEGNVGIGTTDTKGYKLGVNGAAIATSMTVKLNANWPDFVFAKTYGLRPLAEVESYVKAHSHLPEVPSAAQVAKDGINLGEMDATLLKKI